ncbi:MAG: hypothetical protein ACREOY_13450 [Candidatus Dormibacteraceae bacterium]
MAILVAALEDGRQIPLHAQPLDLVMTIVEGTGHVMAADSVHDVRAGDVAAVPGGEERGSRAPFLAVHFTKQNEAYVPLLDRLSPLERRRLYDRLSGAGHGDQHEKEAEPWPL